MKYSVIKVSDALKYLTPEQIEELDILLDVIAEGRAKDRKPVANQYWVVNRDEPYASQVQQLIFKQQD